MDIFRSTLVQAWPPAENCRLLSLGRTAATTADPNSSDAPPIIPCYPGNIRDEKTFGRTGSREGRSDYGASGKRPRRRMVDCKSDLPVVLGTQDSR